MLNVQHDYISWDLYSTEIIILEVYNFIKEERLFNWLILYNFLKKKNMEHCFL